MGKHAYLADDDTAPKPCGRASLDVGLNKFKPRHARDDRQHKPQDDPYPKAQAKRPRKHCRNNSRRPEP
ncbi:hypothetical protein [Moraxella lacunata]|uniref:hypothetical protein n=1 Tax=Moraxella lacunata TaxID=477 RepID=UPI003EDF159B